MQNRKGMTLVELIVVIVLIPIVVFLVISVLKMIVYPIRPGYKLACGMNLKGMANALNVYAFDYRDEYPIQGAGTHTWGTTTTGWDNPVKDWEESTGTLTVASSLFMLVREADVGVKSFNCSYGDQQPFVNDTDYDVVELWDFGPNPTEHQSYSYQFPYGKFPAGDKSPAGNAVMADRNPWFDGNLTKSSIQNEIAETFADKVSLIDILTGADKWKYQIGNSQPHDREGQNVLFADGHVMFERRPDVGFEDDNIYTIGGETQEEKRRGIAPTSDVIDAVDEYDSLLVNDRSQ